MKSKRLGFLPGWRVFTYVILAINLLFLVWVIAGVASTSGDATNCGTLDQETCNSARDVGATIGVGLVIFFWALADVILGVLWLVTRPRRRDCPVCGNGVKRGQTVCGSCGHDFVVAARSGGTSPGLQTS